MEVLCIFDLDFPFAVAYEILKFLKVKVVRIKKKLLTNIATYLYIFLIFNKLIKGLKK